MSYDDPLDIPCPGDGRNYEVLSGAEHERGPLRAGVVCKVCGGAFWQLERLLPTEGIGPHQRADKCEIHGVWLSNGAGTPCDRCTEDMLAEKGYASWAAYEADGWP